MAEARGFELSHSRSNMVSTAQNRNLRISISLQWLAAVVIPRESNVVRVLFAMHMLLEQGRLVIDDLYPGKLRIVLSERPALLVVFGSHVEERV